MASPLFRRRGATAGNLTTFAFGALSPTLQPEHCDLPRGRQALPGKRVPLPEGLPGHCCRPLRLPAPPTPPRPQPSARAQPFTPPEKYPGGRAPSGNPAPYGQACPPTGPLAFPTTAFGGCKGNAPYGGEGGLPEAGAGTTI